MSDRRIINTDWIVEIARKCNNACIKCKGQKGLEIHHIIPLSKGGADIPENTVLLCDLCHKMVHSKKITLELYNEKKYYYNCPEATFNSNEYGSSWTEWKMDVDSTDHFTFDCPRCKTSGIVYKIYVQNYNSLNTPPCFYLKLKCPRCKSLGQRKMYLNWSIDQVNALKEGNNGNNRN